MNIKGQITMFVEKKVKEDGSSMTICSGTISSKNDKGEFINKSVRLKFSKGEFPNEKLDLLDENKCYQLEINSGFLVVESYTNRQKKEVRDIALFVEYGRLLSSKPVEKKEKAPVSDDLPF